MVRFSIFNKANQQVFFEFKNLEKFKKKYENDTKNILPAPETKMIFTYVGDEELHCETFQDFVNHLFGRIVA